MPTLSPHEVTRLLADWSRGDRSALDKLFPLVHAELRASPSAGRAGSPQSFHLSYAQLSDY